MREKLRTHKNLAVWKRSMELVEMVYKVTKEFPKEELYGLTNQLRRAAVSISSNIAEGAARGSKKEFLQFLHVALGLVSEVETQIIIPRRLGYLDNVQDIEDQITTVRKLILGLIRYLKEESKKAKDVTHYLLLITHYSSLDNLDNEE